MTDARLLYVTTKDIEEARAITRALLDQDLVACGNLLLGMESIYRWQGKVETAREVVLILKTTATKVEAVTRTIEAMHSYETPCVLEIAIESGSADYLKWLRG